MKSIAFIFVLYLITIYIEVAAQFKETIIKKKIKKKHNFSFVIL